jgi:hypothetical protein
MLSHLKVALLNLFASANFTFLHNLHFLHYKYFSIVKTLPYFGTKMRLLFLFIFFSFSFATSLSISSLFAF